MKKKVLLKCISNNQNSIFLITVKKNGFVIYKKYIHENENLILNLKSYINYVVSTCICNNHLASRCSFNICTARNTLPNSYIIYFDHLALPQFMTLTDKYYPGLPVEKGELTLCQ